MIGHACWFIIRIVQANSNGFISTPKANETVNAFDWAKPTNVVKV